ncbi:MAG: nickel-binding protein [Thermoleophilia bacterium]
MPRFLVERSLGEIGDDDLRAVADASGEMRERDYPEIAWERSHVVRTADGLMAMCVYAAPDPEVIRAYSVKAGLPVDAIHEIHMDLVPEDG